MKERTDGDREWRAARSWFVISARLVFDLKAVFACVHFCSGKEREKREAAEGVNYISGRKDGRTRESWNGKKDVRCESLV